MSDTKEWLVEINVLESVKWPQPNRTLTYEEVVATSADQARREGYSQFRNRCRYEPVQKRKLAMLGITADQACAGDAVALT